MEEFKSDVKDWCTGESIDSLKRYIDEKWSSYIKRLKEWSKYRGIDDNHILDKLRKEKTPNDLMMIFLTITTDVDDLIARVVYWENHARTQNHIYGGRRIKPRDTTSKYTKRLEKRNITCFKCQKQSHYANECRGQKDETSINILMNVVTGVDSRKIMLNNQTCMAIFDTCASHNFIGHKSLQSVHDKTNKRVCDENFITADGED